uniref:class I SAM-dependent methyltransferase n=1 Tax=Roseovarius indicus TaxID=540747 RepID=UPI003B529CD5
MVNDITPSGHHAELAQSSEIVAPLSSRTLFWRARYLRESRFLTHVPFLFWLIETCRPGFVVKLGLGDGVSYFAACQALDKLETQADCVAIDTGEDEEDADREGIRQYNEDTYSEFSQILRTDLRRAVNRFPDGSIDMLLVDVDADEALIDRLTHDWPRKLSERAVVLFHGTRTRFSEGAAAGFLDRLVATYPTISLEGGDGLLLVLYGPRRHEKLQRLTNLQPGVRGYSEVHHVFRRLGATHEYEWQSRNREERERDLQERLETAEADLARLSEEKAKLDRRIEALIDGSEAGDDRSDRAPALEGSAAEAGAGPVSGEADELKAALSELRREAADRTTELARLTAMLEQAEAERIDEVADLAGRAKDAEERAAIAERDLKAAQEERDAVLASTSWKLTGPLRSAIRKARGIKS